MQTRPTQGFTLVELLVVIGIISILASIAVPVYNTVTEKAQVIKMTSNIKQIVLGCHVFATDWDGNFPAGVLDTGVSQAGASGTNPYGNSGDAWEDLYFAGTLQEPFYWTSGARGLALNKPRIDSSISRADGNNYLSYIENLGDGDVGGLILCFEMADDGSPTNPVWNASVDTHPWGKTFIAGYLDGSAQLINFSPDGGAPVGGLGTAFKNILQSIGGAAGIDGFPHYPAATLYKLP